MQSIIATYENRIHALEQRKLIVLERIANSGRPLCNFDEAQFWRSERLEDKSVTGVEI